MTILVPSRDETDMHKVLDAIRALAQGQTNAGGVATLLVAAGTTFVTSYPATPQSQVFLTPKTANAAAAIGAGAYVSSVVKHGFTITHPANAQIDRTFGFVVLG